MLKVQKVRTVPLNLNEVENNMEFSLELLPPDVPDVTFKETIKTIDVRTRLVTSDTVVEKEFKADHSGLKEVSDGIFRFCRSYRDMVLVGWYVAEYGKEDPRWPKPAPKEDDPHIKKAGTAILIDKSYVLTAIWKKAE